MRVVRTGKHVVATFTLDEANVIERLLAQRSIKEAEEIRTGCAGMLFRLYDAISTALRKRPNPIEANNIVSLIRSDL